MIITTEAQERIIDNWNTDDKSTREFIAFMEGMEAVFATIEKNRIDEAERYQKHWSF